MSLAEYYAARADEYRKLLELAESRGFVLKQVVPGSDDIDVTVEHRKLIRKAIEDCEKAAAFAREQSVY